LKRLLCGVFCRRVAVSLFLIALGYGLSCRHGARSGRSFDDIRSSVTGKTAAQVERLLGAPDSRVRYIVGDERWIWWDFAYLAGADYAPEVRGRVVHVSITFENPAPGGPVPRPYSEWKIIEPLGVSYTLPQKNL
jgi:hypothetical protein